MSLTIFLNSAPSFFRKTLTVAVLTVGALTSVLGQGFSLPDTLKMEIVSVTALSPGRVLPFSIITVDTMLKDWNRFSDIGKLFQTSSPVFVKRYGTDGLASLSIRGMSGCHTSVTWNGLNVNAPMNGMTDFTLLPLFAADKLTLTMGGGNLVNLSGSMGGSLDIASSPMEEKGVEGALSLLTGSYGTHGGAVSLSASSGRKFSSGTRIWIRRADNNFKFVNENAPGGPDTLRRVNAAVKTGGVLQDFYIRGRRHSLSAHLWYNDAFRELPSPVSTVQQNLGETQADRSFRSVVKYGFSGKTYKIDLSAGYVNDINIYRYNQANIHGDNRSKTFSSRGGLRYFGKNHLDVSLSAANEYQTAVSESYEGVKTRNILSSLLSVEYEAGRKWFILTQLRDQMHGSTLLTPEFTAGATYKPGSRERVLLKANFTRNVKYPSLNDLYWNPGGNPLLKPEVSRGGEISLSFSGQKAKTFYSDFTATLYASNVKNLISWVQVTSGFWSPKNEKEVNLYGAEFSSLTYYNMPQLKLKLSASYNFVGEQLVYIPAHTCNIALTGIYKWLKIGTTMLWNSRCYTPYDNSKWLFGYFITDMLCGATITTKPCKIDLDLTVSNILNVEYESVKNYPMPCRSIMLNLIINPKF